MPKVTICHWTLENVLFLFLPFEKKKKNQISGSKNSIFKIVLLCRLISDTGYKLDFSWNTHFCLPISNFTFTTRFSKNPVNNKGG